MSNSYPSQHHSFDVNLARKLHSCELAILVHHFTHWIKYNEKLGRNYRDGKYWTYQTHAEICAHYPYWTPKQVRTMLDKLVSLDVLIKGNYNKSKIDNTTWFTLNFENSLISAQTGNHFGVSTEAENEDLPGTCPNGQTEAQTGNSIPHTKTTHTEERRRRLDPTEEFAAAAVPKKKEEDFKCATYAKKIYDYLKEFSKERSKKWIIPQMDLFFLCRRDGCDYVGAQLNHMTRTQEQSERDVLIPSKKNKANPVDKPKSYLELACKNNYANFIKQELP